MNTLGGLPFSRATLRADRFGVMRADVWLPDDVTPLAKGQSVALVVGDLPVCGTLRPGGPFGGSSYWTLVGGAGVWDQEVGARSYHDNGGVMLSRVFRDLVKELGGSVYDVTTARVISAATPDFAILDVPDRSLGVSWTREAGLASEALAALSLPDGAPRGTPGQWYVDARGATHVGAPPARSFAAPATLTIPHFNPATLAATLIPADDAVAALLPGCALSHPSLSSPLSISSVVIRADADHIEIDAIGEKGTAELFRDLVASMVTPDRYARTAPMQVQEVQTVSGQPVASVVPIPGDQRSLPIPGSPLLSQIPGVPGCTAQLAVGAGVLVAWPAADPASPAIVAYLPGVLPAALTFAAGALALNGPTSIGGPVGSGAPIVYDLGGLLMTWIGSVTTALGLLGHPVTPPSAIASATGKVVP